MHLKGWGFDHVTQSRRRPLKTEIIIWLHVGLFAKESEKAEISNVYLGSSLRGSDEKVSESSKEKIIREFQQAIGAVFS